MAAPLGNQNASKAKKWSAAIERALCRKYGKALADALDDLAERFIDAVEKGDLAAFKEFGDRMEGKPAQSIEHSGPDGEAIPHKVEVILVRPDSA
jgi:hypothetical protein